jgi:hypothetical protein
MNFPTNKPSQGGVGNAGGVGIGVLGAPPAQSFNEHAYATGSIQFQPHWSGAEDAMASSIIRLECQKDELNAEVALLREQARIMQAQNNELREVMAEIVTWVEDDLRDTVDSSYRKAVETAQKLTEGLR